MRPVLLPINIFCFYDRQFYILVASELLIKIKTKRQKSCEIILRVMNNIPYITASWKKIKQTYAIKSTHDVSFPIIKSDAGRFYISYIYYETKSQFLHCKCLQFVKNKDVSHINCTIWYYYHLPHVLSMLSIFLFYMISYQLYFLNRR